jgi:hypothetical protein
MEYRSISGGMMVSDFDDSEVPKNCYTKAVNLSNGINKGRVGSKIGNTLCPITMPSGINKIVGSCVDKEDNLIYYLTQNSLGSHVMAELNTLTDTPEIIFEDLKDSDYDILKFSPTTEISSFKVIDGGDVDEYGNKTLKILTWTDSKTDLRYFNVGKSRRYIFPGISTVEEVSGVYKLTNDSVIPCKTTRYVEVNDIWYRVLTIQDGFLTLDGTPDVGDYENVRWSYRDKIQYNETLLIKAPPITPVKADFFTNTDLAINNLRRDMFQFVQSFEYADSQSSVWSSTSKIAFAPDMALDSVYNPNENNGIRLSFDTGDRSVEKIRLAFRKVVLSPNDYTEIVVLNKQELGIPDNATYTYDFYNDTVLRAIPFAEINNIDFDRVPLTAGCLEILNNGSLAIADTTDGFDLEPIDLNVSVDLIENSDFDITLRPGAAGLKCAARYKLGVVYGEDYGRRTPSNINSSVANTLGFEESVGKPQGIFWELNNKPPLWATWYAIVATKNLSYKNSYYGISTQLEIKHDENTIIYAHIQNLANLTEIYGTDYVSYNFSKGDRIKLHKIIGVGDSTPISVSDAEILADVFITDSTVDPPEKKRALKVKLPSDLDLSLFTTDGAGNKTLNKVLFEAYTPKIESDFDNIYYHTGNVFRIQNPGTDSRKHLGEFADQTDSQPAKGCISEIDSFIRKRIIPTSESEFPNSAGSTAVSAKTTTSVSRSTVGDLTAPFVHDPLTDPGNGFNNSVYTHVGINEGVFIKVTYDLDIVNIQADTRKVRVELQRFNGSTWGAFSASSARVYDTPPRMGQTQSHTGQTLVAENVTLGNNEKVRVQILVQGRGFAATYKSGSTISISFSSGSQLIEDLNYSDDYTSVIPNTGTPTIVDPNYRRVRRKSTIIHTDPLVPETNINGLNRIYAGYFKDYDLTNGAFKRLIGRGDYLYGLQENDTINIPIGKTIISTADGATQMGLSTNLLNQSIPYQGNYGLGVNSTAVVDTGVFLYMVDVKNGVFARIGNNGFEDIGLISGFSNWIRGKCHGYLNTENFIKLTYDFTNKEVLITFNQVGESVAETLAYSEINEGFTTFYSFTPEHSEYLGSKLYTFSNGKPWVHGRGLYNTFYNNPFITVIDMVFNGDYPTAKVARLIKVVSNNLFVPFSIISDTGCETSVFPDMFDLAENTDYDTGLYSNSIDGVYCAPIPMDVNSEGGMFDGLPMRGKIFKIQLQTTVKTTEDILQGVYLGYRKI